MQQNINKPAAFTIKSKAGLLNVLITDVNIHIPNSTLMSEALPIKAIWDTGATGSAITKKVANLLGLTPTGMTQVNTANGIAIQNTYTIDIGLPNRVLVKGIIATEVDALAGGCDALIGMDVINFGDFSVTNHNGVTCMSFRIPSSHEIDYVKNINQGIKPVKQIPAGKSGSNHTPAKKKRK